ncbi:hypothetical protein RQ734_21520 [Roseomonas mucosa]|uniref:hypothetical protein n=1 Tax=Roseomonas mucosa TaxID=207340 RepID=UPI0028CC3D05|nr:hypothetical protein [Roseomonas mucosa]MDT8278639.1 hypothetical protein [Roseomonas mucosa]
MARRTTPLADLDIHAEGLAQQDGLAERLARNRSNRGPGASSPHDPRAADATADEASPPADRIRRASAREPNDWRQGKSMVQVALSEESHVELSIIAKRRRITLSQLAREALDLWLERHGHTLRVR